MDRRTSQLPRSWRGFSLFQPRLEPARMRSLLMRRSSITASRGLGGADVGAVHLLIQVDVVRGHAPRGVAARGAGGGGLGQALAALRIAGEAADGLRQRQRVAAGKELRAAVPQLAKGADVAQDQRAAVQRRLQRRQAERLVPRRAPRTATRGASTRPPARAPPARAPSRCARKRFPRAAPSSRRSRGWAARRRPAAAAASSSRSTPLPRSHSRPTLSTSRSARGRRLLVPEARCRCG